MTAVASYLTAAALAVSAAGVSRRRPRQLLLLGASYVFYATWGLAFLGVLAASSLLNFALGASLRRHPTPARLWTGVSANVALLVLFKYAGALAPAGDAALLARVAMPVGMSFWTLQAIGYLCDVYRRRDGDGLDPSLLEFCLYLGFWPTVLMGPVTRLPALLPQLRTVHGLARADVAAGLGRIGAGLAMKLVLADTLGAVLGAASPASGRPGPAWGALDVWVIAIGFAFQLFFDFAGYSHVAIGAARIFGYRLPENFDAPYLATTPSVFWTRWHMSLSSWIRDYVFLPAAMLRREPWWRYLALLVSMALFGLWHGAAITFLLWGLYHGLLLVLHRLVQQGQRRLGLAPGGVAAGLAAWALTLPAICLGWILFRADDVGQALAMLRVAVTPAAFPRTALPPELYRLVLGVAAGYFASCGLTSEAARRRGRALLADRRPGLARDFLRFAWERRWWWMAPAMAALAMLAGLILSIPRTRGAPFIYAAF
jgi:alginate O-acetyltransferase complex protein AlgI